MQEESNKESEASEKNGQVEIKWNRDFDEDYVPTKSLKFAGTEVFPNADEKILTKGRCKRCWGGLIGKQDQDHQVRAIRCRVCGEMAEDDKAASEYRRMEDEGSRNLFNLAVDQEFSYSEDGKFLKKIFPPQIRQPDVDFHKHVTAKAAKGKRTGWDTRSTLPAGSAGFGFLQAKVLMSGLQLLPRELSAARFPTVEFNDDGSATLFTPRDELAKHSKTHELELLERLGSNVNVAMMSAFACELAMKAICLTRLDEARRKHDLWRLYRDLPPDSRKRLEADFPDIGAVLKNARYTFDKWRYFEANDQGRSISAMIDSERTFALAKAARVILDEGELMGLDYSVKLKARQTVTESGRKRSIDIKQDVSVTGREAPPKRD